MQKRLSLLAATLLVVATMFLLVEKADAFNTNTPVLTTTGGLIQAGGAYTFGTGANATTIYRANTSTYAPSIASISRVGTNPYYSRNFFAWTGALSGTGYVDVSHGASSSAADAMVVAMSSSTPIGAYFRDYGSVTPSGHPVVMYVLNTTSTTQAGYDIFVVKTSTGFVLTPTVANASSTFGDYLYNTFYIRGTSYFYRRETTNWRLYQIQDNGTFTLISTTTTPASYVDEKLRTFITGGSPQTINVIDGSKYCYLLTCVYKGTDGAMHTINATTGNDISVSGGNFSPWISFTNGFSAYNTLQSSLWLFQDSTSFTTVFNGFNHLNMESTNIPNGYFWSVSNGRAYFQKSNNSTFLYWDLACQTPGYSSCELNPISGVNACSDGAGNFSPSAELCNGSTSVGPSTGGTGTGTTDLFDGTGATYVADDTLVWSSYSGATCGTRGTKWSCQNEKGLCLFDEPSGLCGKSIWYNNDNFSCQIQGDYCMPISSTGSSIPSIGGNGQLSGTGTYSFGSGQTIGVLSSTGSTENGGLNMTGSVCKDMFAANGKFLYSLKAGSGVLNSNGPMSAFAGSGSVLDGLGMGDIFQSLTEITSVSSFMDAAFGIPKQGHEYCFMGKKVYMPVKYGLGTDIPDEWRTVWDPSFISDQEHFNSLPGGTFYKKPWNCLGGLKYECLEGDCNAQAFPIHNKYIAGCYVSYSMQDITPDNPNPKGTKKLSTEVGDSLGMTLLDYVVLFLLGYAVVIRIMKFTKFESETPKQDS